MLLVDPHSYIQSLIWLECVSIMYNLMQGTVTLALWYNLLSLYFIHTWGGYFMYWTLCTVNVRHLYVGIIMPRCTLMAAKYGTPVW